MYKLRTSAVVGYMVLLPVQVFSPLNLADKSTCPVCPRRTLAKRFRFRVVCTNQHASVLTSFLHPCPIGPVGRAFFANSQVFKQGLAKSIHHARVLIKHRHIRYVKLWRRLDVRKSRFVIVQCTAVVAFEPINVDRKNAPIGPFVPLCSGSKSNAPRDPSHPPPTHGSLLPSSRCLCVQNSVGKQLVNVPQFMVRMDSEKHIDFSITSPYGQGRPGRVARKRAASKAAAGGGDDGDESDE